MASTDPVAIDMACLDLVKKTSEEGTQPFIDQVDKLLGENTIRKAEALNIGTTKYNLINIDGDDSDVTDSDVTDSDHSAGSFISFYYDIVLLILLSFI